MRGVERAALVGALQQLAGVAVELVRDLVDVLRLPRDRHISLLQRLEVVLQPRAAESVKHALPVALRLVVAEVRDHLAGERVDRRRLPDPVRTGMPVTLPGFGVGSPYSEKALSP